MWIPAKCLCCRILDTKLCQCSSVKNPEVSLTRGEEKGIPVRTLNFAQPPLGHWSIY